MGPDPRRTLVVIPAGGGTAAVREAEARALGAGHPVLVAGDAGGQAVLDAAARAREDGCDALLTVDPARPQDAADGSPLLEAAKESWPAVVVGTRQAECRPPGRAARRGPLSSDFWVRLECGTSPPAGRTGTRLYPVDFLLAGRFLSRGAPFETEAIVRASWAGLPVLSAPLPGPDPDPDARPENAAGGGRLRLAALHAWLLLRSLLPWPHRRMRRAPGADGRTPSILSPGPFFRRLSREYSSAGELAAAAFVGIFIGALPIIPFGLATIVYVNHKLHLNKLAGAAASNVCVAPFVPFLCMEVGHFLRYGRFLYALDRHTLLGQIHLRLWEWLIGALVIGPVLGLAGAAATYCLVRFLRARRQEDVSAF